MKKKGKLIKKILTFIGSFIAALSVVASFFPDSFSFFKGVPNTENVVYLCVVIMMLALFFINWKQNIEDNEAKFRISHEATHRYAHLLRDTTYEIEKISKNGSNDAAINHLLVSFSNGVVSCVKTTLCALFDTDPQKNEVMVSVKTLEYKYWNNSIIADKDAATFKTISRSIIPKGALQADDAVPHQILECTPFHRIFTEGKHDWTGIKLASKQNIEIISEDAVYTGFNYLDSCPNWSEYYTNKIVVPIRVKLSEIDDKFFDSDERNLYGFLCVEYKKKNLIRTNNKFDEDLISILDLLKTYADTMYTVYDKAYNQMSISKVSIKE